MFTHFKSPSENTQRLWVSSVLYWLCWLVWASLECSNQLSNMTTAFKIWLFTIRVWDNGTYCMLVQLEPCSNGPSVYQSMQAMLFVSTITRQKHRMVFSNQTCVSVYLLRSTKHQERRWQSLVLWCWWHVSSSSPEVFLLNVSIIFWKMVEIMIISITVKALYKIDHSLL